MRRSTVFLGGGLAIAGTLLLTFNLRTLEIRRLNAQVNELEQKRQELRDYIARLSASRRVAQVDVIEQKPDQRGQSVSAIVWHEIGRDGVLSEPQTVEVVGDLMYVEAAVIKFDHEAVGKGDPEKAGSVAVFRRIFGDRQIAALAPNLDASSRPSAPRGASDSSLEQGLWGLFWQLMSDPDLARQYGVRVAQCEAPAVRIKSGQIWEVALDAAGGLNLRLIGERKEITYAAPSSRRAKP